ncbi:MAG: hypothetical protein AB7I27_13720 [Bacteriovoracaceae bacterium]
MKTEIDYYLENIANFLTNSFGNCPFTEMEEKDVYFLKWLL